MKVVITKKFKEEYKKLFDDLQVDVAQYGVSLQEGELATYFNALQVARENGKNLSNKFYRLPLEEPPFDVDMDARTITVPTEFKNTGVGVKGDTNAEIIFFKVPRWFDSMDLSLTPCVVQWYNANNKKVKQGNSPVIFTDVYSEEVVINAETQETESHDYALLGWVITDEMTEQSGSIEFALRFYTLDYSTDPATVSYSIATQKSSCAIKGTLDLDVVGADLDTDLENLIRTRPIYSGIINSLDGAAPTIILDLDNTVEYELSTDVEGYEDYAALTNEDGTLKYPDGILRLTVEGESPNKDAGGTVVYRWYRGKEQVYDILDNVVEEDNEYVVTTAGTYFAQIGNHTDASGTRWVNSKTAVVPAAAELKYGDKSKFPIKMYSLGETPSAAEGQINYTNKLIFDVTGYNKASDVKYTWTVDGEEVTEGVTGNTYIPPKDTEGIVICSATNYRNNTKSEPLTVETSCALRAWPDKPQKVKLTYNDSKITAEPIFPAGSKSANYPEEWVVSWTCDKSTEKATGVSTLSDTTLTISPVLEKPELQTYNTYIYRCKIYHKVFNGSNMVVSGELTESSKITLKKDKLGNVSVEYEEE